jgi:outer membrane protein OmpA-like peptidoglycan-associated protein
LPPRNEGITVMRAFRRMGVLGIAGLAILGNVVPCQAGDCQQVVAAFNRAVDAGRESDAQQFIDRIATDAQCGRYQSLAQRRLAAFRLYAVQSLMARGRPAGDYERLLVEAEKPQVLWQASATLGDVRFGQRRFVEAAQAFDRAIEIVKNEALTPTAPTKFDIDGLFDRAGQARLLAANDAGEKSAKFVKTARNQRDGTLGGLYSPSVRGIVPRAIPIPITFEFAKTAFTSVGELAARELVTAIKEQQPREIVLVGHTDVRGPEQLNMKLSQERAEAVAGLLRENGIEAKVETVGKGSTEPMPLGDTSGLSQDDIYALNRRVEWRRP